MRVSALVLFFLVGCAMFMTLSRQEIDNKNLSSLVLTGYGQGTYQYSAVETYLEELRQLNLNTASFLFTCYTKSKYSSEVDCNSYDSPGLEELSDAIVLAKRQGFLVNLRVYVDLKDFTWRCHWNPKNKKLVLDNLDQTLTKMAKFAERRKVEVLILGAEYCQLTKTKYKKEWQNIIRSVRKEFHGKITYGANGANDNNVEWNRIPFWNELDYIGIDHYQPLPENIQGKDIETFQTSKFKEYEKLSHKLNRPILITEIGFPGQDKGHLRPFDWQLKGSSNQTRQASNYRYTLKAIKKIKSIQGVFIWRKLTANKEQMQKTQSKALDYELYHRKAWYEIQNFFQHY